MCFKFKNVVSSTVNAFKPLFSYWVKRSNLLISGLEDVQLRHVRAGPELGPDERILSRGLTTLSFFIHLSPLSAFLLTGFHTHHSRTCDGFLIGAQITSGTQWGHLILQTEGLARWWDELTEEIADRVWRNELLHTWSAHRTGEITPTGFMCARLDRMTGKRVPT